MIKNRLARLLSSPLSWRKSHHRVSMKPLMGRWGFFFILIVIVIIIIIAIVIIIWIFSEISENIERKMQLVLFELVDKKKWKLIVFEKKRWIENFYFQKQMIFSGIWAAWWKVEMNWKFQFLRLFFFCWQLSL